jgi:hypothetical protein
MLRYNPGHVSNSTMPIFRRLYCIITASGIVTLCKRPYITPGESNAVQAKRVYQYKNTKIKLCMNNAASPLSLARPFSENDETDAVITQYDLLKMSIILLQTCRGLKCNIYIVIE